ncbi:type IV pilus biogenesis/stability protein PilW [Giesbergeria anulus]|uniref:Type IV pilus assembly protein PilF n=1 Tax=Giesbergeria anulus TaxID=180197 RepID=A0A1H9IHB8_9BURK|nr:type IV pilus biogenesis/stability protein PilW [Giesbergeria anulus]SEQ73974.1 type IV pilus assembly protein PilF [Giesbergeria anulus]
MPLGLTTKGRYWAGVGMLLCCLGGLSGCATGTLGNGSDPISSAQETDVRRRARIRLELAANYFESGQTSVALDEAKQALATDSSYADAYNLLGLIHMRLNDYAQADASFQRALDLRPADSGVLHNRGWLLCVQQRYPQANEIFLQVLTNPAYMARSKTLMAQGLCHARAGDDVAAEQALMRSYELDAGNPVVAYHLSSLLFKRKELVRAQFYIRRLNNSDLSNAETLWLGVKVERALGNMVAMKQLADQLRKRFPDSAEQALYDKGRFDE